MDKRTLETKQRIETALVDELIAGNVPTIKGITHALGLNRNTFYLHYSNIEDATQIVLNQYTNQVIEKVDTIDIKTLFDNPQYLTQVFIDTLCKDDRTRKFTLESKVSYGYVHELTNMLVDHVYERYLNELNDRGDCYYSVNFLIAGFIHSIYKSINQGYCKEKIDLLQAELTKLVQFGVSKDNDRK